MSFADTWKTFRAGIAGRNLRLLSELKTAWESMNSLLDHQIEIFDRLSTFDAVKRLDSMDREFSRISSEVLIEAVAGYRRLNPQQRVYNALNDYDRSLEDIIRTMPESLQVSGPEWMAAIGSDGLSVTQRARLLVRRKEERVAFRDNLLYGQEFRTFSRKSLEGPLLKALAEMTLELLTPWQLALRASLPLLLSDAPTLPSAAEVKGMHQRRELYARQAENAVSAMESWLEHHPARIANRFPLHAKSSRAESSAKARSERYFRYREFWLRQTRAVEAQLDVHARLVGAENKLIGTSRELLESLSHEHLSLLDELDGVVDWLKNWRPRQSEKFPPAQAEIVAAAVRISAWKQSVDEIVQQISGSVELSSAVSSGPRLRPSWKTVEPRAIFRQAFEKEGLAVTMQGLAQLETQHQSIIREIERAREVVAFALDHVPENRSSDRQIEQEGIANALSLLEFHREHVHEIPPAVEQCILSALAATFLRTHTVLDEGQWGVLRQAARYGAPAAARSLIESVEEEGRAGVRAASRLGSRASRELLVRIGWISPSTNRVPHVIARGYLSRTLGSESKIDQLPMIYQRLFRLVPVEDLRFLIGRQEELAAIAEAFQLWQQGHDAAALLVGERGSGKTSLINCALQSVITGTEVIRGEFSARLTRKEEMTEFLAKLVGTDSESLESELSKKRRVIVLEEMERTFLRRIQHYGAIRALINLISRTSRHTLWIVSTNYFAFRFLNASLRLDPHFSHRINAMAVEPRHLREAILMRHHLSGLRLQFAPRPEVGPYGERLRRLAGIESDPESEFFDWLHRESGGVFRSAFGLWHRYIERVEGGVLYVRSPAAPALASVLNSLTDVDMFTLAAILQHGSLTPREHSIVFRIEEATSSAWMDNLLARELIEPDPGRQGLRVVPEAGEIVRQMLFQRNLG